MPQWVAVVNFSIRWALIQAILISLAATTTRLTDVPVFWPILLVYFLVLFGITMKGRVKHMIEHKYVPWNIGKRVFKGKADTGKVVDCK